jgi:predicted MFS family arabinose efflux permease
MAHPDLLRRGDVPDDDRSTIIAGFGLGICAGAIVLSRIARQTDGRVLAAALWHALYNMTSATAASRGVIAAVTTTCVMVWAAVLLIGEARRGTQPSALFVPRPR